MNIKTANHVFLVILLALISSSNCLAMNSLPREAQKQLQAAAAPSQERDINQLTNELTRSNKKYMETIESQKEKIASLENKLDNGITFSVWSGIVLSSASVIVTVVGVLIALLSFIGYRQIKEATERSANTMAEEVAKKIAEQVAMNRTPIETQKALISLIDDHKFDEIIQSSVEKIIYRGIGNTDEDTI